MFGPPQPAASTKALSAVESSSTSDPRTAAQNLASASASAASNDTDLITLDTPGRLVAAVLPGHLDFCMRSSRTRATNQTASPATTNLAGGEKPPQD